MAVTADTGARGHTRSVIQVVEMIKAAHDDISEREMARAGGDFTAELVTRMTDRG